MKGKKRIFGGIRCEKRAAFVDADAPVRAWLPFTARSETLSSICFCRKCDLMALGKRAQCLCDLGKAFDFVIKRQLR